MIAIIMCDPNPKIWNKNKEPSHRVQVENDQKMKESILFRAIMKT